MVRFNQHLCAYIPQKTNVATVTCLHGLNESGDWAEIGGLGYE